MNSSEIKAATPYDLDLAAITDLTWLPWVGQSYAGLAPGRKVLIVGESHYSSKEDPVESAEEIESYLNDPYSTREMVEGALIHWQWPHIPTLANLHQLLFSPANPEEFWGELCYYNFIQRPMRYRTRPPERPIWEDFWKGWSVFLHVIRVLKPDHVLFIGVEAANHFNCFMPHHRHDHVAAIRHEKIGTAYARTASLSLEGFEFPLHFIRHCGSYFSADLWSDYLHRNAPDMMASLAASARVEPRVATPRQLHVLGMAKSSLNLKGAKEQKLELDFLRLAYAVRDIRESGEDAVGYLMVLDDEVAVAASKWIDRYHCGDAVIVLCCPPPRPERVLLAAEKANNALGFLPDDLTTKVDRSLALADFGKELGERHLRQAIEDRHVGVTALHDVLTRESLPLHIAWDFYGTLPTAN